MKIVFLIDNLDSGGAERQIVLLATLFHAAGNDVSVLGYCKGDFYLPELQKHNIEYKMIDSSSAIDRLLKFRKEIRKRNPDAVIAFMYTPSILAEFASVPFRRWKLIISERSYLFQNISLSTRVVKHFHIIADYVVSNSHRNAARVLEVVPCLRSKLKIVYNGLDLNHFKPADDTAEHPHSPFRIICVASHQKNKNAIGCIKALSQIPPAERPSFVWYGSKRSALGVDYRAYLDAVAMAKEYGVEDSIRFEEPEKNLLPVYQNADALILPSFIEGLPNVVCEAMACGLPVLMGENVSDSNRFIQPGINGFLFEPENPTSIKDCILSIMKVNQDQWAAMRKVSRDTAESLFSQKVFFESYHAILQ